MDGMGVKKNVFIIGVINRLFNLIFFRILCLLKFLELKFFVELDLSVVF